MAATDQTLLRTLAGGGNHQRIYSESIGFGSGIRYARQVKEGRPWLMTA
jgi:hypothetical protein